MDASKLDRLAAAFEARGIAVLSNLRRGARDEELDALEAVLEVQLPQDLRTLYRWRNGHIDPTAPNKLVFRDNAFVSTDEIPELHSRILEGYSQEATGLEADDYRVDLSKCVPFAHFDGAYYAIACGDHTLTTSSKHPVVGIFLDIAAAYYTLESMIDTCIDWVEQPDYEQYSGAPREREIVERHNPGIFEEFYNADPKRGL